MYTKHDTSRCSNRRGGLFHHKENGISVIKNFFLSSSGREKLVVDDVHALISFPQILIIVNV